MTEDTGARLVRYTSNDLELALLLVIRDFISALIRQQFGQGELRSNGSHNSVVLGK